MRSRRSLIFRLTLCLLLGAVTSWLVAWGLATAVWAGWWQAKVRARWHVTAIKEPYLIRRSRSFNRIETSEGWTITRLDREDTRSRSARRHVERLRAWEGEPSKESSQKVTLPGTPSAVTSLTRRDSMATEFDRSHLSQLLDDETWTMIHHTANGWPWRCLSRARTSSGIGNQWSSRWTLTIDAITRTSLVSGVPIPLELPLHPIWPGLLFSAGFYGTLWAVPLVGVPLLRTRRRRRKGRCPRCGYDLKHAFDPGCPECGWGRSGGT
jgi:hypothetical protein